MTQYSTINEEICHVMSNEYYGEKTTVINCEVQCADGHKVERSYGWKFYPRMVR